MQRFEEGLRRYFSEEQLAKIRSVRVGIAGAGGLGSNVAVMLARSGFGRMTIVDCDAVDAGNLNRQAYDLNQIGVPKVEALQENLRRICPSIELTLRHTRIDMVNATALFGDCDAIVEALDDATEKARLVEAFAGSGKFLVAASGIAGYGDSDRIRTRKISETFYIVGDFESGIDRLPPLAPRVMVAAAKQADMVLAFALSSHSIGFMEWKGS